MSIVVRANSNLDVWVSKIQIWRSPIAVVCKQLRLNVIIFTMINWFDFLIILIKTCLEVCNAYPENCIEIHSISISNDPLLVNTNSNHYLAFQCLEIIRPNGVEMNACWTMESRAFLILLINIAKKNEKLLDSTFMSSSLFIYRL